MKFLLQTLVAGSMSSIWMPLFRKDFYNERHPEESRTKRVTKSIVKIPQKVIAMPVNGSVRIMKGSFKQVKKIRNITKLLD